MATLSSETYWNDLYKSVTPPCRTAHHWLHTISESYVRTMLWHRLFPRLLPRGPEVTLVEVGSAPGANLIQFAQQFGMVVYGIEYTAHGVALNRALFARHGIDEKQVIEADFLSDTFHTQYARRFDVVFSQGFIEHFDDAGRVVALHANLVKPGGSLVISIPNLRGVHRWLGGFFNRPVMAMHNLDVMRMRAFGSLFSGRDHAPQYCGYAGVFNLDVHDTPSGSPKRILLVVGKILCLPLQWVLRLLCPTGWLESRTFSPYLVYIGRVRAGDQQGDGAR